MEERKGRIEVVPHGGFGGYNNYYVVYKGFKFDITDSFNEIMANTHQEITRQVTAELQIKTDDDRENLKKYQKIRDIIGCYAPVGE